MKASTALTAACGEHYVASFLSGLQLIVALPRAGVPGTDLLVANSSTGPPMRIQVKTARDARGKTKALGPYYCWDTSCTTEDEHLWFAYVSLNGWPEAEGLPELFFVPSCVVAPHVLTQANPKRPTFWFPIADAEKYRGLTGLEPILERLQPLRENSPSHGGR